VTPWTVVHGILQGTGVHSLSLFQKIISIQGSNPGLPHCRQILYQLSHKGSWLCEKKKPKKEGIYVADSLFCTVETNTTL